MHFSKMCVNLCKKRNKVQKTWQTKRFKIIHANSGPFRRLSYCFASGPLSALASY